MTLPWHKKPKNYIDELKATPEWDRATNPVRRVDLVKQALIHALKRAAKAGQL